MKFATMLFSALAAPTSGGSMRALVRLLVVLAAAVAVFTVGFQVLMTYEGQDHSWWTAIYWTVVTMTTLGFGDIVFTSDAGRMYSVAVLVVGATLVLVLLPFTFIQLVYLPFRSAAQEARAPRRLASGTSGHLLLTGRSPLEEVLVRRAATYGLRCVLIVEDLDEAVALHDRGYDVMVGLLDDPQTWRAAQVEHARLVVAARGDRANTNVAFTVREVGATTTIIATADSPDAVDVLELAGCDEVIQLGALLGRSFAGRILAPTAKSQIVSTFEDLVIAETSAAGTQLVGRTLRELELRARFGVTVIGLWDRGRLDIAGPDTRIEESSILVMAGRREQLDSYDEEFTSPQAPTPEGRGPDEHVVILGGGRVGRATANALADAGVPYRLVDRLAERISHLDGHVVGDAADREVLRAAGLDHASAVVITTHDDDTNVFLTLYARRLREDAEILTRVNEDRNLTTMHRAGADVALSYASTGAMAAWNAVRDHPTVLLAEGLVVFRVPVPAPLTTRTLRSLDLDATAGCVIIGVAHRGHCRTDFEPDRPLPADADLVLIGDTASEERFLGRYVARKRRRRR